MKHEKSVIVIFFLFHLFLSLAIPQVKVVQHEKEKMVLIPGGSYKPFFSDSNSAKIVRIKSFLVDKYPVTNEEFLSFAIKNPLWRKSKAKRIFADANYLSHWKSDFELGENVNPKSPVTNISWFAAKAYAASFGKRLSTIAEWEYIGRASASKADGTKDSEYKKAILRWYSLPNTKGLQAVGKSKPNYYHVYDLHGLIWEWVLDFNTALVTGESRGDTNLERNLFCGNGAVGSSDFSDYAAFMRFGFRSSLQATYAIHNLGFRCVKDLAIKGKKK
ncbi:MAG: formylglycine-generating enzyme family protein [Ignavibacteriaceae bacterium]|nr:formylglycine-generating enzyme family protein [Ignavibacteriaceae bacterium]